MAKKKGWSYNAGEKGRNWVRAFEDNRSGVLMLEWFDPVQDEAGAPVLDARGKPRLRRRRLSLGHRERSKAVQKAEELAKAFGKLEEPEVPQLSVRALLTLYRKEVTPGKGASKQGHDRRACRVWLAFFDAQEEEARRSGRHPATLDRIDWERFCLWREAGRIRGWDAVGRRAVEYDVKFLIAVLGWATGASEGGAPLLERNPWGREWRQAQGLRIPKNPTPLRPAMTDEVREALTLHAPNEQFALALLLGRYTVSRNSSVRQLRWSDVDLSAGSVRWRGEHDKSGREVVVPLLPEAVEALRHAPRGLGDAWVFPSERHPEQPTPRNTFQVWLSRAKARWIASVEDEAERARLRARLKGLGFHGEKRAGVRDPWFRSLDPKKQEALSRTNHRTLVDVYDEVGFEELQEAVQQRQRRA